MTELSNHGSAPGRSASRLARVARAAAVLALTLGCAEQGTDTLAEARRRGVIRIGYAVEPPYAFLTPDGAVSGESPAIARVISQRLGIEQVEWYLAEFDALVEGLEARRFDVIAAGMFITPERSRRVAFSSPTFKASPGLLVRRGNPRRLHTESDLARSGEARVAVLSGSVEERRLRELGIPASRLIRVPDALSGVTLVESGGADALALSAPTLRWSARRSDVELVSPGAAEQGAAGLGAFAFRRGDRALHEAWERELTRFLRTDEHRRMVAAFGFTDAEMPDGPRGGARSP